ncbi:MAG: hypothetical protein JSW73_00905 [Candidatus Woesearchaeota archaeon]|nr:MAG: hypothetical protein JSW73_00905 [Candidatus Woesearchaeota archaeon]
MSSNNASFSILKETEPKNELFLEAAEKHLTKLETIKENLGGVGEGFVQHWMDNFSEVGSPLVINLDHNASDENNLEEYISKSEEVTEQLEDIVRKTAGHTAAYKMNSQSMLTFLVARKPRFVPEAKKIYRDECEDKFGIAIDPVFWIDEKIRDIPSTSYQVGRSIYLLDFDAIHCMPQIGPDVAGALQIAASELGNKGVVHVINMTHEGYKYVKKNYFKDENETVELLRKNALGNLEFEVDIGKKREKVNLRTTGSIEPANRPYEIFKSMETYGDNVMIISIGIGPQGALPGCALYGGATCEGIGRFMYLTKGEFDLKNIKSKSRACKRSQLLALDAKYNSKPYPLDNILSELKDFNPKLKEETKLGLYRVYSAMIK